jgi:hypothetical protein
MAGLVELSYLSITDGLKFGGQITFHKSRENDMIPPSPEFSRVSGAEQVGHNLSHLVSILSMTFNLAAHVLGLDDAP